MDPQAQLERSIPFRWLGQTLVFTSGIALSVAVNLFTALESRSVPPVRAISIGLFAACAAWLFVSSAKIESARYRLLLRRTANTEDFFKEIRGFAGGGAWVWLSGFLGALALVTFYLSLPSITVESKAATAANDKAAQTPSPTATP
jgi:hypothetical protein